ncbi:MAG: hypothetical protein HY897_23450 [Deltaproteobacteria bacterium]|nr:hypothetical protein [Deltaproteobacteria bacterium]
MIKTYHYGAWGEDHGATGPDLRNPYRWTAREWDPTGLQYNRARYYASSFGGWINEDLIGMVVLMAGGRSLGQSFGFDTPSIADLLMNPGMQNGHRYSLSNPTNATDPFGEAGVPWFKNCLEKKLTEAIPTIPGLALIAAFVVGAIMWVVDFILKNRDMAALNAGREVSYKMVMWMLPVFGPLTFMPRNVITALGQLAIATFITAVLVVLVLSMTCGIDSLFREDC